MARAPVSKTGGWGFESLHSCQGRRPKPHAKSRMAASFARPIFKRNDRRQGLDRPVGAGSRLTIRRTGSR